MLTEKFKIYNRETSIIVELLTSGLESLRKISKNKAHYYQAFFSLSMGLERLMKLILHLNNQNFKRNHNLLELSAQLKLNFSKQSIEYKILNILNDFAMGDRYKIVDYLSDKNQQHLEKELIIRFYKEVIEDIFKKHPKRNIYLINKDKLQEEQLVNVVHTDECLRDINRLNDLLVQNQRIEYASRYCVMYTARIIQPLIQKLSQYDIRSEDYPYFSEHFRYLEQDDNYFKTRKIYRS